MSLVGNIGFRDRYCTTITTHDRSYSLFIVLMMRRTGERTYRDCNSQILLKNDYYIVYEHRRIKLGRMRGSKTQTMRRGPYLPYLVILPRLFPYFFINNTFQFGHRLF